MTQIDALSGNARDLLRQANDQLLAADARAQAAEALCVELRERNEKLTLAVAAAKARAEAAESRLGAAMAVLGPSLVSRIRRGFS